jgi:hypothetical protein
MFNGFTHALDPGVVTIIQQLAEQVGAADYVRTPQFQKNGNSHRVKRKNSSGQEIPDVAWEESMRLRATEIVRKEGVEASIDKIRVYLNKVTDKSFERQKDAIFNEIQALVSIDAENDDNLRKVSEVLFAIASKNIFYSSLYADLYKELLASNRFIRDTLDQRLEQLDTIADDIEWCDPQKEYDRFCDINKANENRRATVLFYVNLMKRGVIHEERIIRLISDLCKHFMKEKDQEGKTPVVEELSELIGILVINCWTPDKGWESSRQRKWISHWRHDISTYDDICHVAGLKTKDHKSLSNKSVFKHMDIRDALNKLISN